MTTRTRRTFALTIAVVCLLAASWQSLIGPVEAQSGSQIQVDAAASRHAIDPRVYGVAYATAAQLAVLNVPVNRWGGNSSSRHNWQTNGDNRGSDWYFESIPGTSSTQGAAADSFIQDAKSNGAEALLTIPLLPWIGKEGAGHTKLASFSAAKYGLQQDCDWSYYADACNGILQNGNKVTGNDPNDANVASTPALQKLWIQHLVTKWGTAANGGQRYYIYDNEPSLWHGTHRDVHPAGQTMTELRDMMIAYGTAIRQAEPGAVLIGPEEWGWSGYFYSGYDQKYNSETGCWSCSPDKTANGGMDYLPWLLQQMKANETATGARLLNVFTVHFYPQGGQYGSDTSTSMQALRNRSTRALWDPSYTDESWIGDKVQLIPRLRGWVNSYYPGTETGITEYNWGAEAHINGATTQADILGIFGREGLNVGAMWTTPDASTPTFKAFQMYRNYDGARSTFGETSVSTTVANPDNLSAFAAERSSDGALTVMAINKLTTSALVSLSLANFTPGAAAQAWQLTSANSIQHLADVGLSGSTLGTTLPAQSITLFVIPKATTGTPSLSVADVRVSEGNSGTTTATFTVARSGSTAAASSAAYATANGTASAGTDYTAASGTVSFAPGETSKTIAVSVTGDTTIESDETFTLTLSGPTNATLARATATGTILNDDFPALSINDVAVAEGNSGTTIASFTVSLSAAAPFASSVSYATADGTATAGSDYVALTGNLIFTAGQTSKTISVTVNGDTVVEPNETFFVNLSGATGATIADAQGVGTITNDDSAPLPTLSINDVTLAEGNSGTTLATFTVSLSSASTSAVTVAYATANGTATAGSDYVAASGTLTFAAGETTKTIPVTVNGDTTVEPNETFFVNLSGATGATIADAQGVGTITNDDSANLSINDVTVAEGNSGTTLATFTVSLSAASTSAVTVAYATANGTATAGSDYVAASGTLTFAAGETTKTIPVTVNGDTTVEPNETFFVNLSGATGATIADAQGVGTITNDDSAPLPTLSINDVTLAEGNAGTSLATFTVSLSSASTSAVTVAYATTNGTATAGSDYVAASGTLTFAAGETTKTIPVTVNGDTTVEPNETFFVNLSGATGATIADAQGVGTITNDDSANLSINDVTVAEGNSGTTLATFTVSLSAASTSAVTVAYATANGTATAGSDYVAASGTLTFAAGETTKTIPVTVNGDTTVEPNETFFVNLSGATGATIADAQGVGTITNDDSASLSINDVTLAEGNSGTTLATFTVSLSAPSASAVTVAYATANGTATAGSDYVAASGTLTFAAGETTKTIPVTVNGDTTVEPNETFFVNLSGATGATIADAQGVGTITNDDSASLSINDVTLAEGNSGTTLATFTVSLSAPSASAVTVAYATANGTATAGSDYVAASGTLTFAVGETTKTIPVTVNGDTTVEPNETFFVNLSGATGATIADAQGVGTITNDDSASLSINDVTVAEGNSGTSLATFTVSLSSTSTSAVTVAYATANGTATAGSDYVAASGTLTFAAGETTKTIPVTVNGDTVVEPNETFFVNLSGATGATIADAQGVGTITNDDSASLSINDVTVAEGNSGTSLATFTVSLSAPNASAVTVAYATANGTATAGSDYVAASGTLTFAAGETTKTIPVTVNGDTVVEPNETFFVNLSGATGATIADAQGVGTITNDDSASLSINDVTVAEGNSGTSLATFTVSLSSASTSAVTVAYATANGTATAGSDYVAASGTLTFAAGETTKTIPVTVNGDTTVEPNETFFVNLSGATGATIADAQGVGTITNDDSASLSINDVTVAEGNSGTSLATFTVSLSSASTSAVTVAYATANGTATAGSDYVAASGTLTFAAGETTKTIPVTVNGDTTVEPTETFFVNLSGATGATIVDAQGVGTITNDDAGALPTLSIGDVAVVEGDTGYTTASFPVTLSAASASPVSVSYATMSGTASARTDFVDTSGTLTFAPGVTSLTVPVPVRGDRLVEPDETFTVMLSSPFGATLAKAQGTGTIRNDDTVPPSVPGDFNGDGWTDVLWHQGVTDGLGPARTRAGKLYVSFLQNGTLTGTTPLRPDHNSDASWLVRGTTDLNNDGKADVLWHNQKTGDLYVWFMDGTRAVSGAYLSPSRFADTGWQLRGLADFNHDGQVDILWHHQKTGDLYVWLMNGTTAVSAVYLSPARSADMNWQICGLADFDHDGEVDILWQNRVTGELRVWLMKGTQQLSVVSLTPGTQANLGWQVKGVADYTGDGNPDILWYDQATRSLYLWEMNGLTRVSERSLSALRQRHNAAGTALTSAATPVVRQAPAGRVSRPPAPSR